MMERETRKHDIQVHVWITVPGMKFPQIQLENSSSPLSFLGFVCALVLFHLNTLFVAAVVSPCSSAPQGSCIPTLWSSSTVPNATS